MPQIARASPPQPPTVSVIMATYNRGNIIGYAIRSLLRSTRSDWELIVVGDACTDDTRAVVERFADPRIRFVNLAKNCGEQSGPNNHGVSLARAPYIAFLNHDDLWFPDHLAHSLSLLQTSDRPDLVFGVGLSIDRQENPSRLIGAISSQRAYSPLRPVPASLWVFRRSLVEQVGPWRSAREIRNVPSQDWLVRAMRLGARLWGSPHLGAVVISSNALDMSYRDRPADLHADFAEAMTGPDFSVRELIGCYQRLEDRRLDLSVARMFLETVKLVLQKSLNRLGVTPPSARFWLGYWRKGAYLRHLRRLRGLAPDLPPQ